MVTHEIFRVVLPLSMGSMRGNLSCICPGRRLVRQSNIPKHFTEEQGVFETGMNNTDAAHVLFGLSR